jgi:hypothetical protein
MTMATFRNDPGLCAQWADELKNNKLLNLVLEAMENAHPAHHALAGDVNEDVSPTRAAIELGVTRGYSMFMGRLNILAIPLTTQEGLGESEYKEETEEVGNG